MTAVRPAGPADVPALVALRSAWKGPGTPDFRRDFDAWFTREHPTRQWWIAEEAGTPVGMVNLKLVDRMPSPDRPATSWGYLCNLYVLPEHRGRGTGAALVQALLTSARDDGLVRVVLHPSELSVPLYTRLGFTTAHSLLLHDLG